MTFPWGDVALLHDERSLQHYWEVVNEICDSQFAMVADKCTRAVVRLEGLRHFAVASTAVSLPKESFGHEIHAIKIEKDLVSDLIFQQSDWKKLLDDIFAHFCTGGLAASTYNKMTKRQRTLAIALDHPEEKLNLKFTNKEAIDRLSNV